MLIWDKPYVGLPTRLDSHFLLATDRIERRSIRGLSDLTPTNLTAPLTSFIGRERDLDAVERGFRGGARLLTVTGPPGVGKSRLALEYGHARRHRYPGGVWLIDLSSATRKSAVAHILADALELPERPDRSQQLARVLAQRGATLLVLDNAERLIDAARDALAGWLAASPALRALVTSRQRLRFPGEHLIELAPLPRDSANRLFIDRARAVSPGFAPGGDNAPLIDAITDRLERLPLAIELAAARTRAVGPRDLLPRLDRQLVLLDRPSAGVPEHHATLRAAIDRSWQLLEPAAQEVLIQASVFHGGMSLAAAEAVIAVPVGVSVLDCLESLVDRSLLRAEQHDHGVRFSMYAAVAELANEALTEPERAQVYQRHARYFAACPTLSIDDHDNLLAAHGRLVASPRVSLDDARLAAQIALRLAEPSARVSELDIVRVSDQALSALERASRGGGDRDRELTVALLTARANAHLDNRDFAATEADVTRALAMTTPGHRCVARTQLHEIQFQMRVLQWRTDDAQRAASDAVAACPESRPELHASLLGNCALLSQIEGDVHRALTLFENAVAMADEHGAADVAERLRAGLAGALIDLERYDEARKLIMLRLATPETGRYHWSYLRGYALIEQQLGHFGRARHFFDRARVAQRSLGHETSQWAIDLDLAVLAMDAGDRALARAHCMRARNVLRSAHVSRNRILAAVLLLAVDAPDLESPERQRRRRRVESSTRGAIEPRLARISKLAGAHVDVAEANDAAAAGDHRAADAALRRALAALQSVADWERRSDDVRIHARILRRVLSRGVMVVGSQPPVVCTRDGERVELAADSVPYRLLRVLVDARRATPGAPVARDELLARVWPGEPIAHDPGINRLKVTATKLRKLGLGDVLIYRDGGYLLDESVPLLEVDSAEGWSGPPQQVHLPTGS